MASAAGANPGVFVGSGVAVADGPRAGVPWYIWLGVAGVTSASIGGAWDVAWHRSVGRDTFWTAPHLMIQACGVMAAVVGLWLVVRATGGFDAELKANSVSVFGLRAPLGVFLAAWGGVAMLTSAPFDNWWHNAYGLDVKIVSPPHALLVLGIRGVSVGILFLITAAMNRAKSAGSSDYLALRRLFLYMGGLTICGQMFFVQEYTWDVRLHTVGAYVALAIAVPIVFAVVSQVSGYRWAATTAALIYMGFLLAEILIFPLVPAQPKLGPVFYPVTHLVPAKFPILLVVPAVALDLFWARVKEWPLWRIALVSAVIFVVVIFAVEWPFANFLMSKASQNWFFGTGYFDYGSRPGGYERTRRFFQPQYGAAVAWGLARACAWAFGFTWVGLAFGRWMRGVQR